MSDGNPVDQDVLQLNGPDAKPRHEGAVRKFVRHLILELAPSVDARHIENPRLIEDLAYHSLALMELAFALEDEFELQTIDEQTARNILTALDVENHVINELASTGRLDGSAV